MSWRQLDDHFGADYRTKVLTVRPPKRAYAFAWVLVDHAYTVGSVSFDLSLRGVARLTGLDRREAERARDDLKEAGLLDWETIGAGRRATTRWLLQLPEERRLKWRLNDDSRVATYPDPTPSPLPTRATNEVGRDATRSSPKTTTATGRRRSIPNLKDYTGCRAVRGTHGVGHKHDPLGKDTPPRDWPHPKPSYEEVLKALDEEANA